MNGKQNVFEEVNFKQTLDASTLKYFVKIDLVVCHLMISIHPKGSFDASFHWLQNGTLCFLVY